MGYRIKKNQKMGSQFRITRYESIKGAPHEGPFRSKEGRCKKAGRRGFVFRGECKIGGGVGFCK